MTSPLLKSRLLGALDPKKALGQSPRGNVASLQLVTSPLSRITLPTHSRKLAGIPEGAESYFWVFPLGKERQDVCELTPAEKVDPLMQLLFQGGFCYCSDDGTVLSIQAISHKREEMFMQFGTPQTLQKSVMQKIQKDGRFHPVSAQYLRQRGATKFCWVMPDEIFGRANIGGDHGAFVYQMEGQQTGLLFPVLSA